MKAYTGGNMSDILNNKIFGYAEQVHPLSVLTRYNTRMRIKNESVATHSFFTALFVMKLHADYNFDLARALQMALIHDLGEIYTSDIPHDIKNSLPALKAQLAVAEHTAWKKYFPEHYALFKEVDDQRTIEGYIVMTADVISVLQYVNAEEQLGNGTMDDIRKNAEARLQQLNKRLQPYART